MKKYYRVVLVITAALSLVSLLFYRHEYNKLRYVLEVFNYFGKPNLKNIDANCTINVPIFNKSNLKFDEPLSSWQRLENDLYIYSAYNIRENEVQVIGFGAVDDIKDMQCVIFFENEMKPHIGNFRYISIDDNLNVKSDNQSMNYHGYHFYCTYNKDRTAVGITFLTKSNTNLIDAPMLPINSHSSISNYSIVALCVTPPLTKPMHSSEMINFINYHDVIGMDNFIIYDFGISNTFNSYLKELSQFQNPHWKFTYTSIPWNFPFPGIHSKTIKQLIQADCLYRTYKKTAYAVTLSWEEYVVLKYHYSFLNLMQDFHESTLKADSYKLKTLTFCTQLKNNAPTNNSILTVLNTVHFSSHVIDDQPVYIHNTYQVLSKDNIYTREIRNDLVQLNRYKHCTDILNAKTGLRDTSILRFTEDMQNSYLLKKYKADNIFPINNE